MKIIPIYFSFLLFTLLLSAQEELCTPFEEDNLTQTYCEVSGGYDYPSFYTVRKKVTKGGREVYEIEKTLIDNAPQNSDIKYSFTLEKNTNRVYLVLDEYQTDPYLVFAYAKSSRVLIDEECATPMTLNTLNPKESTLSFSCADTDYTIYQKYRGTKIQSVSLQIKKGDNIELLRGELSSLRGDLRGIEKIVEGDVLKNLLIKGKR